MAATQEYDFGGGKKHCGHSIQQVQLGVLTMWSNEITGTPLS